MDNKQNKRPRDDDSDSDEDIRTMAIDAGVSDAWPRFLVVKGADEDKPLGRLSPFAIQKGFQGVATVGFKDIKRLRSGDYLVECSTKKASDLLRKRNDSVFVDRKISVTVHEQLNSSRGVIRCPDLQGISEVDIRDELVDQGVTRVQRVLVTKGPSKVPTNTLFLTFAMAKLPESIKVGYLRVKVTPFIPSPLRCFKCQKFGHGSKNCSAEELCRDCGQKKHDGECTGPRYCVNCEGKHSSSSRDCPKWKLEQDIQKVRTTEKLSFGEARKKVMSTQATSDRTFASVTSSMNASAAPTQSLLESLLVPLLEAINKLSERLSTIELLVKQGRNVDLTAAGAPESHGTSAVVSTGSHSTSVTTQASNSTSAERSTRSGVQGKSGSVEGGKSGSGPARPSKSPANPGRSGSSVSTGGPRPANSNKGGGRGDPSPTPLHVSKDTAKAILDSSRSRSRSGDRRSNSGSRFRVLEDMQESSN